MITECPDKPYRSVAPEPVQDNLIGRTVYLERGAAVRYRSDPLQQWLAIERLSTSPLVYRLRRINSEGIQNVRSCGVYATAGIWEMSLA